MLQQTQMERGVAYFERWIKRFPGIEEVATATEQEVLKHWEGLGYYSRARNIQRAAKQIVHDHGGRLPDSLPALLSLPGIGKYTARAIMSIAFQEDYPVVDGNVERLFARLFAIDEPVKSPAAHAKIWALAELLLPEGKARAWNQALMEFGALVCQRGKPRCQLCPLTRQCLSFQTGSTGARPVPGASQRIIEVAFVAAVIVVDNLIYVQQRPPKARWASLWEFPGGHLEAGELPTEAVTHEVREETGFAINIQRPLPVVIHKYTKYRATLHPFLCRLPNAATPILHAAQAYRWLPLHDLDALAFSAGHRLVINSLSLLEERDK